MSNQPNDTKSLYASRKVTDLAPVFVAGTGNSGICFLNLLTDYPYLNPPVLGSVVICYFGVYQHACITKTTVLHS